MSNNKRRGKRDECVADREWPPAKTTPVREGEGNLRERERAMEIRENPSLLLHIHPVALKKSRPFNFFIVKSDGYD